MSEPFTILVVCLGNICRSPLAERLLRLRFEELLGAGQRDVSVASAGVRALSGRPMDESAGAELVRLGGDPGGFAARQVTGSMATEADLVLTATRDLRSRVLEESPRSLKRTFTIPELATVVTAEGFTQPRPESATGLVARAASWRSGVPVADYDVPDPIGLSAEVHRAVADLLDAECSVIARAVAAAVLAGVFGDVDTH